jgi:hypothetical protein
LESVQNCSQVLKRPPYSEILKVTDAGGRVAYDFATVDVLNPVQRDGRPHTVHTAFWPTMDLRPGQLAKHGYAAITHAFGQFGGPPGACGAYQRTR